MFWEQIIQWDYILLMVAIVNSKPAIKASGARYVTSITELYISHKVIFPVAVSAATCDNISI